MRSPFLFTAEMDPLSNELDLEVKGLRMGLLRAVEEQAQVAAKLEEAGASRASFEHTGVTYALVQT